MWYIIGILSSSHLVSAPKTMHLPCQQLGWDMFLSFRVSQSDKLWYLIVISESQAISLSLSLVLISDFIEVDFKEISYLFQTIKYFSYFEIRYSTTSAEPFLQARKSGAQPFWTPLTTSFLSELSNSSIFLHRLFDNLKTTFTKKILREFFNLTVN